MIRACGDVSVELAVDRTRALALVPVSRETVERLDRFVEVLLLWQRTTNLVAPSTIPKLWTRHVADSLQLIDLAPAARVWIDLGSGGGFPGLVIACALAGKPGAVVHLIESNAKKAAFLREAQRITGSPAIVHAVRIQKFVATFDGQADIVTARALASLRKLCDESAPLLQSGTKGLFLKGQDIGAELTEASKYWNLNTRLVPSRTDQTGRILVVQGLKGRGTV
jgi:16S rRNA (guanine527-N7)-methyltransferase